MALPGNMAQGTGSLSHPHGSDNAHRVIKIGLQPDAVYRPSLDDELAPGAIAVGGQAFYEDGPHKGGVPEGSTKVGFTLRNTKGKITAAFAFRINPQGLAYTLGSRSQLNGTKAGFFVDDFGPAASTIVMRQLIGEGFGFSNDVDRPYFTGREDFQRFLRTIWLPATGHPARHRVFFHDHHLERGFEQRVYFPPQGLTFERSVDLHNLWRVELQMIGLEKYPYGEVRTQQVAPQGIRTRRYRVKKGDTLQKLIHKVAGRHAGRARLKAARNRIIALNPKLQHRRDIPHSSKPGKPLRVYPGEILRLPT